MIDCIAGYHLNPWTCGIAKFNDILARNLEVPVVGIGSAELQTYQRPLLSLKMSEFTPEDAQSLEGTGGLLFGRRFRFACGLGDAGVAALLEVTHDQHAAFTLAEPLESRVEQGQGVEPGWGGYRRRVESWR